MTSLKIGIDPLRSADLLEGRVIVFDNYRTRIYYTIAIKSVL